MNIQSENKKPLRIAIIVVVFVLMGLAVVYSKAYYFQYPKYAAGDSKDALTTNAYCLEMIFANNDCPSSFKPMFVDGVPDQLGQQKDMPITFPGLSSGGIKNLGEAKNLFKATVDKITSTVGVVKIESHDIHRFDGPVAENPYYEAWVLKDGNWRFISHEFSGNLAGKLAERYAAMPSAH